MCLLNAQVDRSSDEAATCQLVQIVVAMTFGVRPDIRQHRVSCTFRHSRALTSFSASVRRSLGT